MKFKIPYLIGFLILFSISCHSQQQEHPIKGEVISIDRVAQKATIKHEDIPGYMEGMEMTFLIKDQDAIRLLNPGDRIEATLIVTQERVWIEKVHIRSKARSIS